MELVSTGYLLSCLRLSMKLIVMSVEQRLKLFLFFVWKATSSYPDLERSVPWWFLWCIRVNFNISLDCLQKKSAEYMWNLVAILHSKASFLYFLWSLANITLNAQIINAVFGEKGTLQFTTGEVFWRCFYIYLSFFTAIFCCKGKFLPHGWKLSFLVIFSIFIFVMLLFETFFKIMASYLSLFKLTNSLTVEVSGILITIAGEEKSSPKYPMKQQPCDYAVIRWSTLWVMNKVGSFKP